MQDWEPDLLALVEAMKGGALKLVYGTLQWGITDGGLECTSCGQKFQVAFESERFIPPQSWGPVDRFK
jgi:hypothetical protein